MDKEFHNDHPMSKSYWQQEVSRIGSDQKRFDELIKNVKAESIKGGLNYSQIMTLISDKHPQLFAKHSQHLAELFAKTKNSSVKRNIIRCFQTINIPEESEGILFEEGLKALQASEEPIAVKAFGMTVLRRICEKYPDLAAELIPVIEILVEQKVSAGIVNRGEKELKKLRKLME